MREGEKVLVVDGGGRGSALIDAYARSSHVDALFAVPGNDLMRDLTDKPVHTYPQLKTTSAADILEICRREGIALVDVAQDNAVEAGLVDRLAANGIPVVGPTRAAGQIEWDKAWAREFAARHDIAQPAFHRFSSAQDGADFLRDQPDQPWFVKAAGLAEGKGALPAHNNVEARQRIEEMKRFGGAGDVFLLESWLGNPDGTAGEEFSTLIISDGTKYGVVGSAQDNKRALDADEGENTGGMGCSSPPHVVTPQILEEVQTQILDRAIEGLRKEGRPYHGVLYLGGMVIRQADGDHPYTIEFNARWGDPEAQVVVPSIEGDFYELNMAVALGDIRWLHIQTDGKARVVVTGASRGYPGNYSAVKGKEIYGIPDARAIDGVRVYGAGVKKVDDRYFAAGGRLFYIVGEGSTVIEARQRAYGAMALISVDGNNLHYRTDIGWRDVARIRREGLIYGHT